MPDTPALKPKWVLLLELLKSPAVIAIVTACLTLGGTLATQMLSAKPEAPKAAQPSMGEVHNVALAAATHAAYCAAQIEQVVNRLPNPLRPPVVKK